MSKIGDFIAWVFISLLLAWFIGMVFAGDKCTRVYRAGWPAVYGMGLIESVTDNWVSDTTKLQMLKYKAKGAVAMSRVFERTVYGLPTTCIK